MNLYFLDKENRQHLVKVNVNDKNAVDMALDDLKKRYSEITSYYQRTWWDEYHRYWIDYGSHIEFYILQEEKYALNVVEDTELPEENSASCNKDYCDF